MSQKGRFFGPFFLGLKMHLQPYERHVSCLISGLLLGLSLVVFCDSRPLSNFQGDEISVHVVGAVDETHLRVKAGATLGDLLEAVRLHPNADVSEFDGIRRLSDGEVIVIPYAGMTTVYVTGAVEEPKAVAVPNGAGPSIVLQAVKTRDDADRKSFLRRKKLKNGEVIKIRSTRCSQTVESPSDDRSRCPDAG